MTPNVSLRDAAEFLAGVGHHALLAHFPEGDPIGRCIQAARLSLSYARHLRLRAYVLPTFAHAMPPAWVSYMEDHGGHFPEDQAIEAFAAEHGRYVSVAGPPMKKGLNVHLVTLFGDLLVDISSNQFTRPDRHMNWDLPVIEKVVSPVVAGSIVIARRGEPGQVAALIYEAQPKRLEYRGTAAWKDDAAVLDQTAADLAAAAREWVRRKKGSLPLVVRSRSAGG